MLITTSENVSGKTLQHLGLVQGSTVRAKNIAHDFFAGLRQIVGGEIKEYTDLMYEARQSATERMIDSAKNMRADAIVAVRYSTCSVMGGCSEVMAYGTAVKFE
ncbi:MAG: YbjQ family protein [Defluviitaleaceae bacterium]|nr:YbjQ family protein [Defluviitaleaceae bacterium]MCL2263325.1 YbjQ family protein [Defluviitaleaceae bacterium]